MDVTYVFYVAEGAERIIVFGGDGSVMEAARAVAGTSTILAVVPGGTGNLLALNLGIPIDPSAAMRLALTGEYVASQGATVHVVEPPAGPRLSRMAALVQFADYVSLYLAFLRGVDPTPIASIDAFKRRLAEHAAAQPGSDGV